MLNIIKGRMRPPFILSGLEKMLAKTAGKYCVGDEVREGSVMGGARAGKEGGGKQGEGEGMVYLANLCISSPLGPLS